MPPLLRLLAVVLGGAAILTALLSGLELMVADETISAVELLGDYVEALVLVSAMVASVVVVPRLRDLETETLALRRDISAAAEAGAEWRSQRRRLLLSLSQAIDAQFGAWGLSSAERDVAGLMLKGMSLKDIAAARATSEATIRQQAQSVYRKSGLGGRAELSAYFLEDLFEMHETAMPPRPESPSPQA